MERMVNLVSTVDRTVVVNRPEYGIRRQWIAKGQTQQMPFDIVNNLMFTVGFSNLIMQGILDIPNMQDKIDLGIEDPGTKTPTRVVVLNDSQKLTLMKVRTYEEFVKELAKLPMSQAHALVDYAVENELIDKQKVAYLKELTGRDIVQIIARKRQSEEIEQINEARDQQHRRENDGRRF